MCFLSRRSMIKRSMPRAMPAAGCLMDFKAERNCSSMGKTVLPIFWRWSCSSSSLWRCSVASVSSEKPLASSRPLM